MSSARQKATVLVEALPYIQKFHGKIIVVKYGGNAMINEELKTAVINDLLLMQLVGMKPVIVHGGGPEINSTLKKLNIETHFVDGLRYTDEQVVGVVEMVLTGKVNKEIVRNIGVKGGQAVGLCGKDGKLLQCRRRYGKDGADIGFVGDIVKVNTSLLTSLLDDGYIPVISPVGIGKNGETYNINADSAAGKVAAALHAEKLVLLTDVAGLANGPDKNGPIISYLNVEDVPQLLAEGVISGGMIPKIECCVEALAAGVHSTHILDGRDEHSILLEVFTKEGFGTMVGTERKSVGIVRKQEKE
ncbi:MAG: acetylglutamate kinase [Firmicutes bacterium]|nr:acetylglutamate kinase [Bacillota bacterium]